MVKVWSGVKIYLFAKVVQGFGDKSADICLVMQQALGLAWHSPSLGDYYYLYGFK